MHTLPKNTLSKKERLKSRKQIDQLFKEGKSFVLLPFRVYYIIRQATKAEQDGLQFGIGVSSRFFKKAVDRNRVKRLARETYRLQKNKLQELVKEKPAVLTVFFIYTGKEIPNYKDLFSAMGKALEKLERIIA